LEIKNDYLVQLLACSGSREGAHGPYVYKAFTSFEELSYLVKLLRRCKVVEENFIVLLSLFETRRAKVGRMSPVIRLKAGLFRYLAFSPLRLGFLFLLGLLSS